MLPASVQAEGTWLDFINRTGHTDPTDYIVAVFSWVSVVMQVPAIHTVMYAVLQAEGTWLDFINSTGHTDPTDYIVDALAGNPEAVSAGNMSEILYVVGNSQCAPLRITSTSLARPGRSCAQQDFPATLPNSAQLQHALMWDAWCLQISM